MKKNRISQTALKVALGLITLSVKEDWAERLPQGMVEISETLLLASGSPGYGPWLMRASKKPWMISVYEFQDKLMPGQWEGFGHRKIFMDQQVRRAIDSEARQVLVLGAGLDTLCIRLAPLYPDVCFFEVDHPATSAAKAKGVAQIGQPDNMIQISTDLSERNLSEVLLEDSAWDPTQLSVVVAEGLFQYLNEEEVHDLLRDAAICMAPATRLIFTHAIPHDSKVLQIILRMISEPFKFVIRSEDLPAYLVGTGWTVVSDVDHNIAHGIERYGVAERDRAHP